MIYFQIFTTFRYKSLKNSDNGGEGLKPGDDTTQKKEDNLQVILFKCIKRVADYSAAATTTFTFAKTPL